MWLPPSPRPLWHPLFLHTFSCCLFVHVYTWYTHLPLQFLCGGSNLWTPQSPRCLLEKEPYFCRILLEKKPSSLGSLLTVATPYVCSVMNTRVRIRTCPTYTTLDIYTQTIHFVHICTNVYCKLIRRNLCVLQNTITVAHKIRLRLTRHNHYSLIPTHVAVVVAAYYSVLTFNSHLVCTPYGACTVTRVYIWDDGDPISGIPSLGPYTDPEIEMSPYTATRQLLLLCVLIDAHQKRKKARQHTHMRVTTVPHTRTYT